MVTMGFFNRFGECTYTTSDECEVYNGLAHELIAKKVNQCTYISRIKRVNNYDGTETITIHYAKDCGGGKRVYMIER